MIVAQIGAGIMIQRASGVQREGGKKTKDWTARRGGMVDDSTLEAGDEMEMAESKPAKLNHGGCKNLG